MLCSYAAEGQRVVDARDLVPGLAPVRTVEDAAILRAVAPTPACADEDVRGLGGVDDQGVDSRLHLLRQAAAQLAPALAAVVGAEHLSARPNGGVLAPLADPAAPGAEVDASGVLRIEREL